MSDLSLGYIGNLLIYVHSVYTCAMYCFTCDENVQTIKLHSESICMSKITPWRDLSLYLSLSPADLEISWSLTK